MTNDLKGEPLSAEFGLLEVGAALARNIKKLVLLPLAIGMAVYGLTTLVPKTYTSVTVLQSMSSGGENKGGDVKSAEVLMRSAAVLDQIVPQFAIRGETQGERRIVLDRKIAFTKVRNEPAVILNVTNNNPETARKIASALITAWLPFLRPSGNDLTLLETKIKQAEADQSFLATAVEKLEKDAVNKDTAIALVSLYTLQRDNRKELTNLKALLEGARVEDVVVSGPTLPDEGQNVYWYAGLLAGVLTALLLSAGILLRAFTAPARRNA